MIDVLFDFIAIVMLVIVFIVAPIIAFLDKKKKSKSINL